MNMPGVLFEPNPNNDDHHECSITTVAFVGGVEKHDKELAR